MTLENLNPFFTSRENKLIADVVKERLALQPHLNTALRAEILYFTTQGIINACRGFPNDTIYLNRTQSSSLSTNPSLATLNLAEDSNESSDNQDQLFSFDDEPLNDIPSERNSYLSRISVSSAPSSNITDDIRSLKKTDPKRFHLEAQLSQLEKAQHSSLSRDMASALREEAEFLGLSSDETIQIMKNSKSNTIPTEETINPLNSNMSIGKIFLILLSLIFLFLILYS